MREFTPTGTIVITTSSATIERTFVTADNTSLTVLNLSLFTLSGATKRQLLALGRIKPEAIGRALDGRSTTFETLRFQTDGVFERDVKIAERGELIERWPIDEVLVVTRGPVRHGSAVAAVLGTLGGFWLGGALAYRLVANTRCYSNCGGVQVAMLAANIGVPIAGGYGAWYGTSRMVDEIIYRRVRL